MLSGLIVPYWFVLEGFKWNATKAEPLALLNSRLPPLLSLRTFRSGEMNELRAQKHCWEPLRQGDAPKIQTPTTSPFFFPFSPSIHPSVTSRTPLVFFSPIVLLLLDFSSTLEPLLNWQRFTNYQADPPQIVPSEHRCIFEFISQLNSILTEGNTSTAENVYTFNIKILIF